MVGLGRGTLVYNEAGHTEVLTILIGMWPGPHPRTPLPSEQMLDLLELLSKTQTHRHNPFQMATDLGTHRCRRSWEIDMLKLRAATGLWTDGSAVKDTCCSGEEPRSLPNTNTRQLSIASYSSSRRPDTFFWPPQEPAHTQCTYVTLQLIHIK